MSQDSSEPRSGDGAAAADLVTAAVFFVAGVALAYAGWTMDRLEFRSIHPLSAPGLVPGLLGLALALCGFLLGRGALKSLSPSSRSTAGFRRAVFALNQELGLSPRRLVTTAALCLLFALGIVGSMPFWLATAIFVAAFVVIFEWPGTTDRMALARTCAIAIVLGLATGVIVSTVFAQMFLLRLP